MIGAYVLRHKGHIRMDIFYEPLSLRKRAVIDSITASFFFLFMVLLIWQGWVLAEWAIKTGKVTDSMWHPILWPIKLAIPIGGFLLLFQGIADFIRNLYFAIHGRGME
ncbi:MAG: TRAP transporter small permease subunit, partial [Dehalococcoidia bacterium]|nr:TRAP transporter small permease subunit [Dehalococcoidia bacterium]